MLEHDRINILSSADPRDTTDILVFLGSTLVFPNSILRIAEQEVGGALSVRVSSVIDLFLLARNRSRAIKKVFIDDLLLADTLKNFDELCRNLKDADWILAYRDKDVARHLLAERARTQPFTQILLLPMTLPICPWASMLRLVLAGHFIAPGDLIGPITDEQSQSAQQANHSPAPGASYGAGQIDTTFPPQRVPELDVEISTDPALTRREREVLALVSQGGSNKTIAHQMSLSEHTVKLHLHNAITKIGVRNRTEAANWFLSRQIGGGA